MKPPAIEVKSLHLILMSADYLMMNNLITFCITFITNNINLVISEGEQVHMYKSHIAKKLAKLMTIEQLDNVADKDDVIFSRLYKKKLEIFFEQNSNLLHYC